MVQPVVRLIEMKAFTLALLIMLMSVATSATAQQPASTTGSPTSIFTVYDGRELRKGEFTFAAAYPAVVDENLASKLMARDMPYRVILPAGYSDAARATQRYSVIYLLHGLTGHFNNWTDRTKLSEYAAKYNSIIVTPEGNDGWYSDSATQPNEKYESYIVKELIPEVDKKYRTMPDRAGRAIAGLSMGGYGALKFGMKYPDMFIVVGSFSGAIGAASITEKKFPGAIGKSIDAILGPDGSDTRKANDPFELIRSATPEKIKALPFLYIDCGTEDFLFQNNREFIALLVEKKVPHEYRQLPGAHDWKYWDRQVQEFLRVSERYLSSK